jgi:GDP-4-dehydro-6-deoxy-D-mannose reductase
MDAKTMKILITGANGFTGQYACQYFFNRGMDVTAVMRTPRIFYENIKIELCDLCNQDHTKRLIDKEKPDCILHLAGQNHVQKSWTTPATSFEANALATLYLLEAVRGVNRECKVVVTGSSLEYDPKKSAYPLHPYSLSKTIQALIAQSWSHLYDMNIIIVKPSNLIGPGESEGVCSIFAQKIIDRERNKTKLNIRINNPQAQRDFLDVRDGVRAYHILLEQGVPGEVYNIASGNSRTLQNVIEVYEKLINNKIDYECTHLSEEEQVKIDLKKIQSLGWKPLITFESSLTDILNFYRKKLSV